MIRHEQQEILVDCVSGLERGDAISFVIVRILHKGHRYTERPAFKPVADQVRAISHDNHEALDAGPSRTLNDVLDDGFATKVNQRFGKTAGDRPNSRPVTGSENDTLVYFFHRTPSHRTSNNLRGPLKSEDQLPPKSANGTVNKLPEAEAVQILLHVAIVGVIEQVEHSKPQLHGVLLAVKGHPEAPEHLKIELIKPWESLIVSRTDDITPFVHHGIRKAGMNIQDWHEHQFPGRVELCPRQEAVGGIEGQR